MQLINNMYQHAHAYWQDVPQNTAKEMVYAFGTGFFIATVVRQDPIKGLIAGSLSALATAIHGLVTPFFKQLTGGRDLTWGEEMCRALTGVITAACVASAFGNTSIFQKLIVEGLFFSFITWLEPSRCSINHASAVLIFPTYVNAHA